MAKVTKDVLEATLRNLKAQAVACGLMGEDEKLIYSRGVASGGVPGAIYVGRVGSHAGFVTRFTLDHNQRDHVLIMQAASYALFAAHMRHGSVKK